MSKIEGKSFKKSEKFGQREDRKREKENKGKKKLHDRE